MEIDGSTTVRMMYDIGTTISVVPEEIVTVNKLTGNSIEVKGYNQSTKLHKLAKVNIKIGDVVLKNHKIVLVSVNELSGKG